mmetsp:Transcript_59207/g.98020  ORF Transcript_59207/g.98020 Transcript_59207/m.98020 type:complete len:271 (-) Transcript_59207:375-1187(-)
MSNKWDQAEDKAEEHQADRAFTKDFGTVGLRVCVSEALGLPHTDWWPKDTRPDGYLRIDILGSDGGDHKHSCQSPALRNHDDPAFNFCCWISSENSRELRIEVWDSDSIGPDESLGACRLEPRDHAQHWCPLIKSDSRPADGKLHLSVDLSSPPLPPDLPFQHHPACLRPPTPALPPRDPWAPEPLALSRTAYMITMGGAGLVLCCLLCCAWRYRANRRRPFARTLELQTSTSELQSTLGPNYHHGKKTSRSVDDDIIRQQHQHGESRFI